MTSKYGTQALYFKCTVHRRYVLKVVCHEISMKTLIILKNSKEKLKCESQLLVNLRSL